MVIELSAVGTIIGIIIGSGTIVSGFIYVVRKVDSFVTKAGCHTAMKTISDSLDKNTVQIANLQGFLEAKFQKRSIRHKE